MPELTGGQALIQQLKMDGLDTVFGLPGIQMDFAFDALWQEREHFKLHYTRHEQAAAYMADGFARSTGKIGMCMVVPGPGLLNAAGALSTAYACSSPVLCVTGQITSSLIGLGRGVLHEIDDQLAAITPITKWRARAMTPEQIPGIVHEAVRQLRTGRPRPVEIEIPPDVLEAKRDVRLLEAEFFERAAPDPDLVDKAAQAFGRARNPVIFAGGGVIASEAAPELQNLAEMLQAPVIMTNNGKGSLSHRHYLAHTQRAIVPLAPRADVVLVVGSRFTPPIMQNLLVDQPFSWLTDEKTLIYLDIDETQHARHKQPNIGIAADAKVGLAAIAERVPRYNGHRASRLDEMTALKQTTEAEAMMASPQSELGMAIRRELPEDGIFVQESTQVGYWSMNFFPTYQPRTFFTAGYQGTLGYGFPTALGVQVGNPDKRVVSISGDGGFFFNVQELSTMKQQGIPLTAIVFNDNAYGNVKRIQQTRFDGHVIASDLYNPDMMKLADAYGMEGHRAKDATELQAVLHDVFSRRQPVLIEVPVPPMKQMALPPQIPLT